MEKITLNNKRYIALGDLQALRLNLMADVYEGYEEGEDGEFHFNDFDRGWLAALTHLMNCIMEEELEDATEDEVKEIRRRLRNEWIDGKFIIVAKGEDGEMYYRKHCGPEEDTPAFTNTFRFACLFSNHYNATCMLHRLESETEGLELRITPLWVRMMTASGAEKLLAAIFGPENEQQEART